MERLAAHLQYVTEYSKHYIYNPIVQKVRKTIKSVQVGRRILSNYGLAYQDPVSLFHVAIHGIVINSAESAICPEPIFSG